MRYAAAMLLSPSWIDSVLYSHNCIHLLVLLSSEVVLLRQNCSDPLATMIDVCGALFCMVLCFGTACMPRSRANWRLLRNGRTAGFVSACMTDDHRRDHRQTLENGRCGTNEGVASSTIRFALRRLLEKRLDRYIRPFSYCE